jgi:hypothetical protein
MRRFSFQPIVRALALLAAIGAAAPTQSQSIDASALALSQPVSALAPRAGGSSNETVRLFVRLADKPLAAAAGNKKSGIKMSADQQRAYSAQLAAKQAALSSQIGSLGGVTLAALTKAGNALVIDVAASQAASIAALPGVVQVLALTDSQLDLGQTVPYIGAAAAQAGGTDGAGVRVAVLDSGIDFTHYNLGGTGSLADYATCYAQNAVAPSGICAGYFGPGAPKVRGGFDFVGEAWTGGTGSPPLAPDPNPIARAGTGGHGTHVADIIGGRSADGVRKGVAPGAQLYAVKVCSAISTSCSGLAILQGMEWALDPDGDGDLADAMDVVNMSLGLSYGQREHPSVGLLNTMSQFGVLVVVSAGNSANRAFITGSPSVATSSISVAQTQVPSASIPPLIVSAPASIARIISNTATVPWATGSFAGNLRATSGPATPSGTDACAALPAGSLAGFVAIVRRGGCTISLKAQNVAAAGAVGMVLDNNSPGDPPSFSQGPEPGPFAPLLVVSIADGNLLRGRLAAGETVTVSTGAPISAVASLVTTSSRGPTMGIGMIKPDIGAPGASLSAEVGTGNGQTVFGGTSGAAPMVAGSAALLLQRYPSAQPHEIKARLMNPAETNITTYAGPASATNALAPITRIGAGEVRVDRSLALKTAAWDATDPSAVSLSIGITRNAATQVYRKRVLVRNYDNVARTYTIGRGFRYTNDLASGGVTLSSPGSITVPANGNATFILTVTVNPSGLPNWASTGINGGANGGDGSLLDRPEYDGYITISDATDTVRLPWHILPHQAHNVVSPTSLALGGAAAAPLSLTNPASVLAGRGDVFYLTGTSPQLPASSLPTEGSSFTVTDLRAAGVRLVSLGGGAFGAQFAINTWGSRTHPNYPAQISVFIDADGDGADDFEVWTQENGGFAATGQNVTFVRKISSGTGSGFFFTDTDFATGNVILTIPLAATLPGTGPNLALTPATTFKFTAVAFDNYFTGAATDVIGPMQINLGNPRFFPGSFALNVPAGGAQAVTVNRNAAGDAVSPSQTGLLMMYRDGRFGREADLVTVTP